MSHKDLFQLLTIPQGDFLQVAIDISGDGHLQLPASSSPNITNLQTHFFSITIFLTSYSENKNLTISNNTDAGAPLGNILTQEPGSTVSHVNWLCEATELLIDNLTDFTNARLRARLSGR